MSDQEPQIVEEKGSRADLARLSWVSPGYDCRGGACRHTPKGDHGWHGDAQMYAVRGEAGALSLEVFTDAIGGRREPRFSEILGASAHGANLLFHAPFAVDEDHVRDGREGLLDCRLVRPCFVGWSSSLQAERFFAEHGDPERVEQPAAFWEALERRYDGIAADLLARERFERCQACAGRGVVPRRP